MPSLPLPLPFHSTSPSYNTFRVKPFENANVIKESTSFVSSPTQPSTPLSVQSTSGLNTRVGLVRPL